MPAGAAQSILLAANTQDNTNKERIQEGDEDEEEQKPKSETELKAQAAWKKMAKVREIQDKQENDKMANITFVYTKDFLAQKRDAKPPIQPAEQSSRPDI